MADENETHKEFSAYFEKLPFAEMMRKMMGREGAVSLCAEMMKKITEHQKRSGNIDCSDLMQNMIRKCGKVRKGSVKSEEEVRHGRKE